MSREERNAGVMTSSTQQQRITTGVRNLDRILGGGLLSRASYIVMGTPGAGKTILANQICYHHVAGGGRALYVTLLAESHERMISHLKGMRFFDAGSVAAGVTYLGAYSVLQEGGLHALGSLIRRSLREHKASLLVLDGLVSAGEVAQTSLEFKRFVHDLQTMVGLFGCTALLLTNSTSPLQTHPEHTMVDGLLHLTDQLVGLNAVRTLEVKKFRGSGYLRGLHTFRITDEGLAFYPRMEALASQAPPPPEFEERVPVGVPLVDELVGAGLPRASSTVVIGPSGAGKTILGCHFLARGAADGEHGLYFGFYESPDRLTAKMEALGQPFARLQQEGRLTVMWHPASEHLADALAQKLLDTVEATGARRLFLDGLDAFALAAVWPERFPRFLAALTNELRNRGVTTLIAQEARSLIEASVEAPVMGASAIVENLIVLRYRDTEERLGRVLSVVKMREGAHDSRPVEYDIAPGGFCAVDRTSRLTPASMDTRPGDPQGAA